MHHVICAWFSAILWGLGKPPRVMPQQLFDLISGFSEDFMILLGSLNGSTHDRQRRCQSARLPAATAYAYLQCTSGGKPLSLFLSRHT